MSPRKVTLLNVTAHKVIESLSLPSRVLALHMNQLRLVIVMERTVMVHDLKMLTLLATLEAPPSVNGLSAMTSCSDPCYLALPSSEAAGSLRVHDLAAANGSHVVCEVAAHKGRLQARRRRLNPLRRVLTAIFLCWLQMFDKIQFPLNKLSKNFLTPLISLHLELLLPRCLHTLFAACRRWRGTRMARGWPLRAPRAP